MAEALEWLLQAGKTEFADLTAAPLLQRIQPSLEDSQSAMKGAAYAVTQ